MAMYMYVRRAGLVWTLVLLITTCFILTYDAAPIDDQNKIDKQRFSKKNGNPTTMTDSTEPLTVSSTPPATSTDEVGSSEEANGSKSETAAGPNSPSEGVSSKGEEDATDTVNEGFLYYQITKCINERNLTHDDINYVLSQQEDENQFMFMLADKLGYMSNGKHDDPHIPVIKSQREKLIKILKTMAEKVSKPPSPEQPKENPTIANKSPGNNEPVDMNEVGIQVSADIRDLGTDAIYALLDSGSFSDVFGYTVGIELNYAPKSKHMKYLENVNVEELKKFLRQTLKSKLASQQSPNEPTLSEKGDLPVSTTPSVIHDEAGRTDSINGAVTSASDTGGQEAQDTVTLPLPDEENESHGTNQAPEENVEGEPSPNEGNEANLPEGDINEGKPSPSEDLQDKGPEDNINSNDDDVRIFSGTDEERMRLLTNDDFMEYLQSNHDELYEPFISNEVDPSEIDKVLKEWQSVRSVVVNEKGAGVGGNEDTNGPKPEEDNVDSLAQPSDDQAKEPLDGYDDDSEVEYTHPRSGRSFGAWHFLGIFLVLGVVVIVGYLCMHNRKKLREGVASYVNDASKRRRRAREYKPLIST